MASELLKSSMHTKPLAKRMLLGISSNRVSSTKARPLLRCGLEEIVFNHVWG